MANKAKMNKNTDPFSPEGLKTNKVGSLTFFYDDYSVGMKAGIQFFRITPDPAQSKKGTIEELVKIIEGGEISDVNDMYGVVRKGYYMSPTTKTAFEQYTASVRASKILEPIE